MLPIGAFLLMILPIGAFDLIAGPVTLTCWPLLAAIVAVLFCTLLGGCFVSFFFIAWWHILRPKEWEITVASDLVRWGDTRRPDRQRRITISKIKRIEGQYDSEFDRTIFEIADGSHVTLPRHILVTRDDAKQCVEAIKKARPEINIQFYG